MILSNEIFNIILHIKIVFSAMLGIPMILIELSGSALIHMYSDQW